jgi:hypothetical protein
MPETSQKSNTIAEEEHKRPAEKKVFLLSFPLKTMHL